MLRVFISPFLPIFKSIRNEFLNFKLMKLNKNLKLVGDNSIVNTCFGVFNFVLNSSLTNVKLGDFSYIAGNGRVRDCKIGKFCSIGPNVLIGLGEHPTDFVSSHPIFYSKRSHRGITFSKKDHFKEYKTTIIGNDVWIGANVIIKGGVNIGNGAIIASGAIVTNNVPSYAIVGGVPAKILKCRFKDDIIESLEKQQWWEIDYEWMEENYLLFHNIKNLEQIKNANTNKNQN